MGENNLLEVRNLKKYFPVKGGLFGRPQGYIKAVDGVSFSVKKGETLGLVGESGCGKTTTGKVLLRLEEATAGQVLFAGHDVLNLKSTQMRRLRSEMQIIFQDPYSSLNPRMSVNKIIGEALDIHNLAKGKTKEKRIKELLEIVGLASGHGERYPHEFSGGQRQRIGIARALAVSPELIICDEPVSALDVSIQAQIINLMEDLQEEFALTYLFIAHDLSVVKHISDRVAVMYLGKIVELANKNDLYNNPLHPYTEALLSAIPIPDPTLNREKIVLSGDVPSPANPPSGCRFNSRCLYAIERCKKEEPPFKEDMPGHYVSCHLSKTRKH